MLARLCVPPHPENCVNATSSAFVFIYVCEYGLILLEQPKLSMYIWRVGLCSCMHSLSETFGVFFTKALNIIMIIIEKKEDDEDGHEDHAKTGNIVFIYNCDYKHISILF